MDALKNELRTTYVALNATFREYLESQGFDEAIIDHYVQVSVAKASGVLTYLQCLTLYSASPQTLEPANSIGG